MKTILEKLEAAERCLKFIWALDALFANTETLTHRAALVKASYECTGHPIRDLYAGKDVHWGEQELQAFYNWLTEPL